MRLIEGLLDTQVTRSRNRRNPAQQFVGELAVVRQVVAGYLDVDRGRKAEIQDLAHDVRRKKRKIHAGKLFSQLQTQIVDILFGRPMSRVQRDQNVGVRGTGRGGVAVRKIDAAVGQTNIVNNGGEVVRRDLFPYEASDPVAKIRGLLDARAGPAAHMQFKLPRVDAGEEIAS